MKEPIVCKAYELYDHVEELDASEHLGFTIGNKGKVIYWYFIWHGGTSGNASIYTSEYPCRRSYIKGDQIIKIHFK